MSLIELMMTPCVIMNNSKISDGEGGFTSEWTDGAEIMVAIVNDTSMQARVAEKDGVTSVYTLTTTRENALDFHDVIKRKSDGQIFRVTSNGKDKESPQVSGINLAQATAEKWELTQ